MKQKINLIIPLGTPHPNPCPDCGKRLLLTKFGDKGCGYACEDRNRTGCRGNAGCHPNGKPLGKPIDQEGRHLRVILHSLIDPYWLNTRAQVPKRNAIYEFFRKKMKLSVFHVSILTKDQLKWAIKIAQTDLRKEF